MEVFKQDGSVKVKIVSCWPFILVHRLKTLQWTKGSTKMLWVKSS